MAGDVVDVLEEVAGVDPALELLAGEEVVVATVLLPGPAGESSPRRPTAGPAAPQPAF